MFEHSMIIFPKDKTKQRDDDDDGKYCYEHKLQKIIFGA